MRVLRASVIVVCAGLLCGARAASAADTGPGPATYVLTGVSEFQQGCFGACACPVTIADDLEGTFELAFVDSDPLFDHYDVTDVAWIATFGDTEIAISGSGSYQIGGEVALEQRLSLDLTVGDDPVAHFDSGLVVGGSEFPTVDVEISIDGAVCYDTVIHVAAKPVPIVETSDTELDWSPVPAAVGYDVVAGDLGILRSTGGDFAAATVECLAGDVTTTSVPYDGEPAPGAGVWFAVRGSTTSETGSYDCGFPSQVGSRDAGIDDGASCP